MKNNILNSEHWEQEHKNHTISLIYFSLVCWSSVGYLGQHSTGSVECGRGEGTKQLLMVFIRATLWFEFGLVSETVVCPRLRGSVRLWFAAFLVGEEPVKEGTTL